jgi:hypothetical protein
MNAVSYIRITSLLYTPFIGNLKLVVISNANIGSFDQLFNFIVSTVVALLDSNVFGRSARLVTKVEKYSNRTHE